MDEHLQVGFLLDSLFLPAWVSLVLEKIERGGDARIALAVLSDLGDINRQKIEAPFLYRVYRKIEDRVSRPAPNALAVKDATGLLKGVPMLHIKPEQSEDGIRYSSSDLAKIREYQLDVLIDFSLRQIRGEIFTIARLGIWYFKWQDPQRSRDAPPGFWEVFKNQPVTSSALCQKVDDQGHERVIYQSYSATDALSVNYNCNRFLWKSASFIPRKLKEVRQSGVGAFSAKDDDREKKELLGDAQIKKRSREIPDNLAFAGLLILYLYRYIKNRVNKVLYHTQWQLLYDIRDRPLITDPFAFQQKPDPAMVVPTTLKLAQFKKLSPPRSSFWSDPFVVFRGGLYYVFFEEYSYKKKKAHISMLALDENGIQTDPAIILEKPYHLSYPFIFEWENNYYMVPEMAAHHAIEVYRCVEFPYKWEFHKTLMESVNALDTTLFQYQSKWWMFLNWKENGGASSWDELFLFYADQPLSCNWTPHPKNPIVSDVRRARPAGAVFQMDGMLIRPSQDSSRGYGYGINLNQILVMDETEYQEEILSKLEPGWDRRIRGLHTFNQSHHLRIIDGKSRRFRFP